MKIFIVAGTPMMKLCGCGGSMAKEQEGHEINVLIMAEGLTSTDQQRDRIAEKELFILEKTQSKLTTF